MNNIIFHVPYFVDKNRKSGSHIRPFKMLDGFRNIGYTVDVIMGYGKERKKSIDNIKEQIKQGKKYDFCYSESSTMPTLLTESHHLPTYPKLDFSFMGFLKKNNIPIGLFYRDCYWLFNENRKELSTFKRKVSEYYYRYDLKKYPELIDVFYLPTTLMMNYLPMEFKGPIASLPPGTQYSNSAAVKIPDSNDKELRLFYVGGLDEVYDMEMVFSVVKKLPFLKLTVCTRKEEWEKSKDKYSPYLNDRIRIIHKSGSEFKEDIENAHISLIYFKPGEYRKFAMPVKLFEYMSYKKPILSVDMTAVGEFVSENKIGWEIPYDENKLISFFEHINLNRSKIDEKVEHMDQAIRENTWEARCRQVAEDLTRR